MRRLLPVNLDLALLVLRLVLATAMLYHGIAKVTNFGGAVGFMTSLDIPAPTLVAAFALLVEVVGGLLILVGVASDIAGLLFAVDMVGAIVTVHWANGFDFAKGGWEHPFTLLGMALAIALAGPGTLALGKAVRR
jgi:putative oxidoreductase